MWSASSTGFRESRSSKPVSRSTRDSPLARPSSRLGASAEVTDPKSGRQSCLDRRDQRCGADLGRQSQASRYNGLRVRAPRPLGADRTGGRARRASWPIAERSWHAERQPLHSRPDWSSTMRKSRAQAAVGQTVSVRREPLRSAASVADERASKRRPGRADRQAAGVCSASAESGLAQLPMGQQTIPATHDRSEARLTTRGALRRHMTRWRDRTHSRPGRAAAGLSPSAASASTITA